MTNDRVTEASEWAQLEGAPDGWQCRRVGRAVEFRNLNARDWRGRRVFPEAHAPSDDERRWAEYRDAAPENNTPDQRRAFFAALRRSEVPEPSVDVVCICGSTRFRAEIEAANRDLTLSGAVVVTPGVFAHSGDAITEEQKIALDALHLRKIDIAARVLVVNPGKYIGESTAREIEYAHRTGKPVDYTHPPMGCEHEDMNCPTAACVELYPPYREDMGR
ncbi:hypothetical protein [Microbacterium sp. NPDC078849]|uniref:hypothetical protein n=1 Tax=unclassified Microbacterium TaxID=2609290 RepID=UPI00344F4775